MTGVRVAAVLAYAIFILFAIGLIAASVWLAQQAISAVGTLAATPIFSQAATETAAPLMPSTSTPEPAASTPTLAPTATHTPDTSCIPSAQAKQHLGETRCVRGTVVGTYSTATAFFVEFDQAGTGFFGSVLDPRASLANLEGKCVQLEGKIQEFKGRPFIIFQAAQMEACPNP